MARFYIAEQLEKSANQGSLIVTNTLNKPFYLPPGAEGSFLQVVSGVPSWNSSTGFLTADNGLTPLGGNLQLRGALINNDTTITTKVLTSGFGFDPINEYKNYYNLNVDGKANVIIGSGPVSGLSSGLVPIGYDNDWFHEGKLAIINDENGLGINRPHAVLYLQNRNQGTYVGWYMDLNHPDTTAPRWVGQFYMHAKNMYGLYGEVMPFAPSDSYVMRAEVRAAGVVDVTAASPALRNQAIINSTLLGNSTDTGVPYGIEISVYGAGHGLILKSNPTQWDLQNSSYQAWTSNVGQSTFIFENAEAKIVAVANWSNTAVMSQPFLDYNNNPTSLSGGGGFRLDFSGNTTSPVLNLISAGTGRLITGSMTGNGGGVYIDNGGTQTTAQFRGRRATIATSTIIDEEGSVIAGITDAQIPIQTAKIRTSILNMGSEGRVHKSVPTNPYTVQDTDNYLYVGAGQPITTINLPDPTLYTERTIYLYKETINDIIVSCPIPNKITFDVNFNMTSITLLSTYTLYKIENLGSRYLITV